MSGQGFPRQRKERIILASRIFLAGENSTLLKLSGRTEFIPSGNSSLTILANRKPHTIAGCGLSARNPDLLSLI